MRHPLSALLCALAFAACDPPLESVQKNHAAGTPHYRYHLSQGRLHGRYERFHENGQLAFEGKYQRGFLVGEWREYHSNGQLARKAYSEAAQLQGPFVSYDSSGHLREEAHYWRDELHGRRRVYNADGSGVETLWERGVQQARARPFDSQGKWLSEAELQTDPEKQVFFL